MVILVAVDRSDRAKHVVEEAAELAQAFEEPLQIIHIMTRREFLDIETTSVKKDNSPVSLDKIRAEAARHAENAASDITCSYETIGRVGDVSAEVTRYAEEQGVRYIVVGGRKRSPAGKAVFGSKTQSILLEADRPVVAIMGE
ncbi:universal stress protein [Halobellus sp. Atlit-38R]|uniref:universal stress protein n=1 Tax=Halobellus TaxID=1073986 RepID=UPI000EF1C066|nr:MULTISPECIES: universal stress protein [Halobellus]RLM84284.1 universal stress protein [Halobellus sp. Atlit-38R]